MIRDEEYKEFLYKLNPEQLLGEYERQWWLGNEAKIGNPMVKDGDWSWKFPIVRKNLLKRIVYFGKPHGTKE
jgi:hypothetical protein